MTIADAATGWVAVARETFEYNMVPWMGRQYEPWLRAWARPHPVDLRGQVLVPERIYRAFKEGHVPFQRVNAQQLAAAGYPEVPGERELDLARRELRQAVLRANGSASPPCTPTSKSWRSRSQRPGTCFGSGVAAQVRR
jgi:hypothetical protein